MAAIYEIQNTINGKRYIGSTNQERHRFARHLSALKLGQHWNKEMQADFDAHGGAVFTFTILEGSVWPVETRTLRRLEKKYILERHPEYNVTWTEERIGRLEELRGDEE